MLSSSRLIISELLTTFHVISLPALKLKEALRGRAGLSCCLPHGWGKEASGGCTCSWHSRGQGLALWCWGLHSHPTENTTQLTA